MSTCVILHTVMIKNHQSVAEYIDGLQRQARYTFTRANVESILQLKKDTLTKGLQRLAKAKRIHQVRRGFYVIVPIEYTSSGAPPIDWFITDLMEFIGHPYYVGVLSAASLHGAAHQRPQEYQVVVPVSERVIRTGTVRIHFFRYDGVAAVRTKDTQTYTGTMPVSTPECTALDLVRFNKKIGGLDAVLTVLKELGEKIQPDALLAAVKDEKIRGQAQRLGWLLDRAGWAAMTDPLAKWMSRQTLCRIPLNAWIKQRHGETDPKWGVIVNDNPVSDI